MSPDQWRHRIAFTGLCVGMFGIIILTDAIVLGHHSVGYEGKMHLGFILALGGGATAMLASK